MMLKPGNVSSPTLGMPSFLAHPWPLASGTRVDLRRFIPRRTSLMVVGLMVQISDTTMFSWSIGIGTVLGSISRQSISSAHRSE